MPDPSHIPPWNPPQAPVRRGVATRNRVLLAATTVLVLAGLFLSTHSGLLETLARSPADSYYNELVDGFRSGHLWMAKPVPPELARLPDPYDPEANHPFRVPPTLAEDASLYHGRFYLYFGVAPAVLLFWPFRVLTGHYLLHRTAAFLFTAVGVLCASLVLRDLRRRYFPHAGAVALAAGILAIGLGSGFPILLARSDVYEVAVTCAYALVTAGLYCIWRALHSDERSIAWLAAAALAFGLGVAARPTVLFSAAVLILAARACAGRGNSAGKRGGLGCLIAIAAPLLVVGLALMVYNYQRFGSPFDFGQRYQLSGIRQDRGHQFGLSYLAFNFRLYFLEPFRRTTRFPFIAHVVPPLGPGVPEGPFPPFGVLPNFPFALFALALPLAWRIGAGDGEPGNRLSPFLTCSVCLFAIPALVTCLFFGSTTRYEMEFIPELMFLAAIAVLALESVPHLASAVRALWITLLVFSVSVSLLASLHRRALEETYFGSTLSDLGRTDEAIAAFRTALRIEPYSADARNDLGVALARAGRLSEAMPEFEEAARLNPDRADVHNNLGNGFVQLGRLDDGIAQYREALRIEPRNARSHFNLALALYQSGRRPEAEAEYKQAVALDPSLAR